MISITLFVITLLFIVSMCLFLIIKNIKNRQFLWVFIPLMLVSTGSTYFMITDLMSQPIPYSAVTEEFQYLSHRVVGDKLFVWVMVKGKDRPWTLMMPRTQAAERALARAMNATKQGQAIMGKPKSKENNQDGTSGGESEFEFYDFSTKFFDLKNKE